MEKPGLVSMLNSIIIDIKYKPYCEHLNNIIYRAARLHGLRSRWSTPYTNFYYFNNGKVLLRYIDLASGIECYHISVSSDIWRDIPDEINPFMIWRNGWIDVYRFQDSPNKEVLQLYVPGSWEKFVETITKQFG